MVTSKLALSTGIGRSRPLPRGRQRPGRDDDRHAPARSARSPELFAAGQFKNVKLGVGAMPGPDSPDGGVLVGGAANYIVNKSAPEKQAAAYQFAKFLASAKVQSEWAAATGYVPVSKSAVTMSPLAREVRAAARVQGRVRPARSPGP